MEKQLCLGILGEMIQTSHGKELTEQKFLKKMLEYDLRAVFNKQGYSVDTIEVGQIRQLSRILLFRATHALDGRAD